MKSATITAATGGGRLGGNSSPAARHCIVTPDIAGPLTNGGIGTACLHLARFIRQDLGHGLDILFTGETRVRDSAHWKDHYRRSLGIDYHHINDLPEPCYAPVLDPFWTVTRSQKCHEWLRSRGYTHIHFQDYHANGFVALQAKRSGLAYSSTMLTVTLHSSSRWMREGNRLWPGDCPVEECLLDYMEAYCAEHADAALSPSRYMLEWLRGTGLRVNNGVVIPNLAEDRTCAGKELNRLGTIAFFGRLESRKGLEVFLEAIRGLAAEAGTENMPEIVLYGRPGNMSGGGDGYHHALSFSRSTGIRLKIRDNLDSRAALRELASSTDLLCVLPSLSDNLPYAVLECLQLGIPFIAANVGGVPELVASPDALFEPTPAALHGKIAEILQDGLRPIETSYDLADVKDRFTCLLGCAPVTTGHSARRNVSAADVTICIAHYNYGRYLSALLESLGAQTQQGFKVVVVDDGSTDAESIRVFAHLAAKSGRNAAWMFAQTANAGIGAARNHAASLAETEFLIFMDADNVAEPDMVEHFVNGLRNEDVDCLTCYALRFRDAPTEGHADILGGYTPVGPCTEAGLYINIYGDANFAVSKSVFRSLGGFNTDRKSSFEDWEFLAHLTLQGFTLEVIPRPLFLYRVTPEGFSRNTSPYLNFRRVLDRHFSELPAWAARVLEAGFATIRRTLNSPDPPDAAFTNIRPRRGFPLCESLTPALRSTPSTRCNDAGAFPYRSGDKQSGPDMKEVESLLGPTSHLSQRERRLVELALAQAARIAALEKSTSWRMTAPLRGIMDLSRRNKC